MSAVSDGGKDSYGFIHACASGSYSRKVVSTDVDEHSAMMTGWDLSYNQISSGPFRGELLEFGLGSMQLARDRTNQAMVKKGAAPEGSVSFSFPLSSSGSIYCSGNVLPDSCVLAARAGNLPDVRLPQYVDVISVSMDQKVLERELEIHGVVFDHLTPPKLYPLSGSGIANDLKEIIEGLERAQWIEANLASEVWCIQVRDSILSRLLDVLPSDKSVVVTPTAQKRLVDRACDYALSQLDEPLSILDLCRDLGASRRKLQYCFQGTLGINAVAYLRALRLNAVHRELRGRTSTVSVQDIATRWGFSHLSRFSREYREMFGECPSQTLHR